MDPEEFASDDDFLASLGVDDEAEEPAQEAAPVATAEDIAALKAEIEKARQDAEEAKKSFEERRSYFDRREQQRQDALRARGLIFSDEGLGVADPAKLLAGVVGVQTQQPAEKEDAEPEIDPYDPATQAAHNKWAAAQAVKQMEARMAAQFGDLIAASQSVIRPRALESVKPFLAKLGVEGIEERPEFLEPFNTVMGRMDLASQANPAEVRKAVSYALGTLPDELLDDVKKTAETRRAEVAAQAERDRQREALAQTMPSSQLRTTTVGQPTLMDSADRDRMDALILDAIGDEPGVRGMLKAINAGTLKNGVSAVDAYNGKLRAGAGRR